MKGSTALQAHVKKLASLFDFGARDSSNEADRQQANLSQEQNQSQQSGDASKSSEIIIEDDPEGDDDSEERRRVAVSVRRVVQQTLTDNDEWQRFYKEHVEPLTDLTKSKLGADQDALNESENNIFDADFMDTLRGDGDKGGDIGDDLERADGGSGEDG